MQSSRHGSRPQVSPLDNAFSPAYLARLRERDDSLTAAEAELAGPWKIEPVPGRPGAVAILRIWEDLAVGDPPVGVLWHLETARLLSEGRSGEGRPFRSQPPPTSNRPLGATSESREIASKWLESHLERLEIHF